MHAVCGRKNSPLNHHRMPNYDKFPQLSFLVGLSLHQRIFFRIHKYFRIYYILYWDLQTAFTHINSSRNIRQSVAKYIVFTFDSGFKILGYATKPGLFISDSLIFRERQHGSTTKMSQIGQESGQICSSLNLTRLFAGEILAFQC